MKIQPQPSLPDAFTDDERAVLELRAALLRKAPEAEREEAQVWLASFALGELMFALPLESLRAAVPLRMVTPVPLAPANVIGVLRFRGSVLTVLSLAALLGVRGWKVDPAVLLVVETNNRLLALDCEEIPRALAVPRALVDAARAQSDGVLTELVLADKTPLTLLEDVTALSSRMMDGPGPGLASAPPGASRGPRAR